MNDPKIPRTVDGEIIYPGMTVYICTPYAINNVDCATVYCVIADVGNKQNNDYRYWCVLVENRYYNARGGCWEDGDTEIITRLFANYDDCRNAAIKIEQDDQVTEPPTIYDKNQDLLRGSVVR